MPVTCPRCKRSLSSTDPGGPPHFCMYCGQKLRNDTPKPTGMLTASHVPFSDDPDADASEPPPSEVGGYRLVRFLGAGGMGAVYEAEAPESNARVAVKLLSSRLSSNPASVERFRQEGRLASQLAHPRCVFVLAADTDAGRPYIVMELMPGRTLKDLVDERGPLPADEAIGYVLDAIDGLIEAHRLGVLHRDVKPSNCFLTTDGRAKIGDFGLSKSLAGSSDAHLTQTGAFLGTVLFASPEQIRGEPLDYASDVYSVCATLYYLLCGEAPYQHESVTAALAKAISEPPPPICGRRPDVSRALERVVMAGLERDRDRRWATLDELRDALVDLLPSRQTPARPRALVGAFLLDWLVLFVFTVVPLEVLRSVLTWGHVNVAGVFIDPVAWAVAVAYFATLEGLLGRTAGKALLGLRVSKLGQTGPPGLNAGWVRALVFAAVWMWLFYGPAVAGRLAGGLAALLAGAVGVAGLLVQLRHTEGGFRGLHDLLSGCHVTQRPHPTRKLRLVSRHPNPLDVLLPADTADPLPETVGGYKVRGRVWADGSGEQVWAAEDRALGRRVLLWLMPDDGNPATPVQAEAHRPTRLRRIGRGSLRWSGKDLEWVAFAAPVGAPLADTIRPDRPLPWADARLLLEHLVDELQAADEDGSTPDRLGLGQVWVESTGRLQLIDCPMAGDGPSTDQFALVRQVAALTLEGHPRMTPFSHVKKGRTEPGVHAPVPPHAAPILTRLFTPGGYATLADLHRDLIDTHTHSPEVTPAVRAAQLGIQGAVLSAGLFVMFVAAGIVAIVLANRAATRAEQADATLKALVTPSGRDELQRVEGAAAALDNARAVGRVVSVLDRKRAEADDRRAALLHPQRFALDRFEEAVRTAPESPEARLQAERELLVWAAANEKMPAGKGQSPWDPEAGPLWAVVVLIPLAWVAVGGVTRGGLSMVLTGIAVVRSDGRRATRRQCAVRAAVVWLPVAGLLLGSVWLQVYHYRLAYLYAGLWLAAAALLPIYVVVALRYPSRPPQDRIAGTYLVPA